MGREKGSGYLGKARRQNDPTAERIEITPSAYALSISPACLSAARLLQGVALP